VVTRRHVAVIVAVALMFGGAGLTGCGVIKAVKKVASNVEGDKTRMAAFTNKIKAGEGTTFEATYVTTGSSPAKVVYAVEPPKGLLFQLTPAKTATTTTTAGGTSNSVDTFDVIVNPSGEYSCSPPSSSGARWTCEKLPKTSAADYNNILDFYTPAHWVTFLDDAALAAGFAGDKVSSSSLTVNGFPMSCVDLVASGVPGTSRICTTAQNILGYVKVAGSSTSFEITSYSSSPAASLFGLPPGAKVVVPPTTTTAAG
jgi:hypothetical protein